MLVWAWHLRAAPPGGPIDIDQIQLGAQTLLRGGEPYTVVEAADWTTYPLYYPLTTAVIALPLGALPMEVARLVFLLLGAGVLGYAIGRERPWAWPILLSIPFLTALRSAQWSPILTGAMFLPALGFLAAAKPNVGLVMLARCESHRSRLLLIAGGLGILALSFAADWEWLFRWREALSGAPHFSPLIARPGGLLMLAGLYRWQDPEARMLVALSLIPQTGLLYETLPALTVARNAWQGGGLTVLSWGIWFSGPLWPVARDFTGVSWISGMQSLCLLLPALGLVLWRCRAA